MMGIESKKNITTQEYQAWLAGFIDGLKTNDEIQLTDLHTIHTMALKIVDDNTSAPWPTPYFPQPYIGDPVYPSSPSIPEPMKIWYTDKTSTTSATMKNGD